MAMQWNRVCREKIQWENPISLEGAQKTNEVQQNVYFFQAIFVNGVPCFYQKKMSVISGAEEVSDKFILP